MRELVLQLAVQGKLVEQDPNDESAEAIIRATELFFVQMALEKKITTPKQMPVIEEEELPFRLPSGWAWCRLGQILRISSGDGLSSKDMEDGSIPVYGGNGITGYHNSQNITKSTLVIGRVGYYCGSVHVTPEKAWVTDNAFITTFAAEHMSLRFIYWLLKATDLRERDNALHNRSYRGAKYIQLCFPSHPLSLIHI
jgi:type I restriction enzyme S subunit